MSRNESTNEYIRIFPVKKCHLNDSASLTSAYQTALPKFISGMPELNIEVLDPMMMDDLSFDVSGLQFSLQQGRLTGLKTATIDRVIWDLKEQRVNVNLHLDCSVRGLYRTSGWFQIYIFPLPVSGHGNIVMTYQNIAIQIQMFYKMAEGADGKIHVEPTHYEFEFEIIDNASFNLSNISYGEWTNTHLNNNWRQVSKDFGRPVIDNIAKKLFKNVAIFFAQIPIEDIAVL